MIYVIAEIQLPLLDLSCNTDQKHGERAKDSLRGKISQYLERAEQLKKFLAKRKSKTHFFSAKASTDRVRYLYSRSESQTSTATTIAGIGRLSEDRKKQLEGRNTLSVSLLQLEMPCLSLSHHKE